jgi:S-methylmethionine-dependent homocysteine/selenocysteine methylase
MPGMLEALGRGEVVVLDGGTGTELEARGARMDGAAWCGLANLEVPALVREVHEDYIRAGADVIIANTFATNRPVLAAAGHGDRVEEANRVAVAAALDARDRVAERPVAVAGSMSDWWALVEDETSRDDRRVLDVYREQGALLAEAGAELIVLEMFDVRWTAALEAARETGLPVWAGIWARVEPDGALLAPTADRPLEDDLPELMGDGVSAVLVMHSPLEAVDPALAAIARHWDGPRGAYPHAGHFEQPHWIFKEVAPDAMAGEAETWVRDGARIVGGCCGTRPDHIRAISDRLSGRAAATTG